MRVKMRPINDLTAKTIARFWSHVDRDVDEKCWEWRSHKEVGYGRFSVRGISVKAHRYCYYVSYGPIPKGAVICHTCDNPGCVNPKHLYAGTYRDNAMDAITRKRHCNKEKVSCIRGHRLIGGALRLINKGNGKVYRQCKICDRLRRKKAK